MAGLLTILAALVASSCSSTPKRFEVTGAQRVLVFPFENLTGQPNDAGKRLTAAFSAALARNSGMEVVEPGEVERFIDDERIRGNDDLSADLLRSMGARFNVQMIVIGSVSEFGYVQLDESVPIVGLSVRVVDPRSGRLVWSCSKSRDGNQNESVFRIGKVLSLARLTELLANDMTNEMSVESKEIAKVLEARGTTVAALPEPAKTEPAIGPAPAAQQGGPVDEDREQARRELQRHWDIIKGQYGGK